MGWLAEGGSREGKMSQSALPTELNTLVARYMYMYSTAQKKVKVYTSGTVRSRYAPGSLPVRSRYAQGSLLVRSEYAVRFDIFVRGARVYILYAHFA